MAAQLYHVTFGDAGNLFRTSPDQVHVPELPAALGTFDCGRSLIGEGAALFVFCTIIAKQGQTPGAAKAT